MKASYKEAGRTRKWLISVLAGFMAIFACFTPLLRSIDAFADSKYQLVLRTADGGKLMTVDLGDSLGDGGNYIARVSASGNDKFGITIENNLTGEQLGYLGDISSDRITSNGGTNVASADFNYKLELWQNGGTVASGTPISMNGGMQKRAWVIASDDDGDGTYEVIYSQTTGDGYTSM